VVWGGELMVKKGGDINGASEGSANRRTPHGAVRAP